MASSNTRLDKAQKAQRKDMLAQLPDGSSIANDDLVMTVLCVPDGAVTRVYSAVASDDEQKFRRKVGEYVVLNRWLYGEPSAMILPGTWWTAADVIQSLAEGTNGAALGTGAVTTFKT